MPRDIDGSNYYTMADDPNWDDIPYVTTAGWFRFDSQADWMPVGVQRFRDDINGRFFGWVLGASHLASVAADWLVSD